MGDSVSQDLVDLAACSFCCGSSIAASFAGAPESQFLPQQQRRVKASRAAGSSQSHGGLPTVS